VRSTSGPAGGRTGTDAEQHRRAVLNTIGPVWDGNEVWLITAGGAMFAAFPEMYATVFSGLYLPLLAILCSMIVRVVAIEWRGKIDDPGWRRWADIAIAVGSWVPAILWGVAFAGLVHGMPVDAHGQMHAGIIDVVNPYTLLGGLATGSLFALHGAVFVALKSSGTVRSDAFGFAGKLAIPATVLVAGFGLWTQLSHGKTWTWIVLLFGALYPNLVPSTLNPDWSLTIYNGSSSPYTLKVMTWAALVFAPLVMVYQAWTYWVFRKRISADRIPEPIGLSRRSD
jgi:cytochrome d ubiquinol oxidase subunit II